MNASGEGYMALRRAAPIRPWAGVAKEPPAREECLAEGERPDRGRSTDLRMAGRSILVGHTCPLVEIGLLAALRGLSLHEVATIDEVNAHPTGAASIRPFDVVVADHARVGSLVRFASRFRRSSASPRPKVLLIDADADRAPVGTGTDRSFDARLSLGCRQADLADALDALLRSGASANPRPRGGLSARALRRVRETVEQRLSEKLVLEQLAAVAGMSRFHFARAFKKSVGQPPHRYVMARRVSVAADLITQTDRSLTEISLDMGFFDQSHFSRVFTQMIGESPSAYRRRHL